MNISELRDNIKKLDWSSPKTSCIAVIDSLIADYSVNPYDLIQKDMKGTWEKAVLILNKIGYPRNKRALPKLIWLLKDINWPGSKESIEVLKKFDRTELAVAIIDALKMAYNESDYMWIGGLKMLIDKLQLHDEILVQYPCLDYVLSYSDF